MQRYYSQMGIGSILSSDGLKNMVQTGLALLSVSSHAHSSPIALANSRHMISTAPKGPIRLADCCSPFGEHRSVICAIFQHASCYFAPNCCRRAPSRLSAELGVLVIGAGAEFGEGDQLSARSLALTALVVTCRARVWVAMAHWQRIPATPATPCYVTHHDSRVCNTTPTPYGG